MAYKLPQIPTIPNPVFIDLAIQEIQTMLANELPWLEYSFGRSYEYFESRSGEQLQKPFIYGGSGEYTPVQFNDNLESQSFFVVGDRTYLDYEKNQQNFVEIPIGIIFWANLKAINQVKGDSYYFAESLINDVKGVFQNATLIHSTWEINEIIENKEEVLAEFDFNQADLKYFTFPYTGFRFNLTLTIQEDCAT